MIKKELSLSENKVILLTLANAEQEISKITKDYAPFYQELPFLRHLLTSLGYLRNSITSLNKEIIRQDKNGN